MQQKGPAGVPDQEIGAITLLQDQRSSTTMKTLVKEGFDAQRYLCVECSTDATVKILEYGYCNKHAARALRDNLALLLNKAKSA